MNFKERLVFPGFKLTNRTLAYDQLFLKFKTDCYTSLNVKLKLG